MNSMSRKLSINNTSSYNENPEMTPEEIHEQILNIPYMTLSEGIKFTDHIIKHDIKNVLELGFLHGVSTCYIAAALQQTNGIITTIDRKNSLLRKPDIYTLLKKCELDNVNIYAEYQSYTWRLMHMIADKKNHQFDLAFIDGGHTWDDTGYAFFLVDQLLLPGGWMIFDDYCWCHAKSPEHPNDLTLRRRKRFPQEYNDEFENTEQVKNVIELLVRPHPNYTITEIVDNRYVFVQKKL
jgi:predicted O-methyltransferase YrrM